MKILVCVHHYPPRYVAGAEQEARRVAHGLAARGHAVQVLCVEETHAGPEHGLTWSDGLDDGIPVRRLAFDMQRFEDPARFEYDNPWIGAQVVALLDELRPDLLFLISGYLLTASVLRAAAARGVPAAVELTDFWFLCPRITLLRSDGTLSAPPIEPVRCARCLGEERRRYRLPARVAPGLMDAYWRTQTRAVEAIRERDAALLQALIGVDLILSPSHFVGDVHAAAGVPPEKIAFVRQGMDLPAAIGQRPVRPAAAPLRIGYLGQIASHKGVHILVEAVKQVAGRLSVSIYGDTQAFPRYAEKLRRSLHDDARFALHGVYHGAEELGRVLQGLDVIVVPSVWYENSPTVILEAFAYGVPVIASDLGGMAELVRHGEDGLRFKPGDAADLARQIRRLIAEPDLLGRLQAGIRPVKTVAQQIDEMEALFAGVIAARREREAEAA